jgi:Domain of unknown function (DUF4337)
MTMKLPPLDKVAESSQQPFWQKVITSTPVVMAVLSTLLAGLSNSELNTAQYFRAIAAQDQSKAGDQWSFFQAKKMRSAGDSNTGELLVAVGQASAEFSPEMLKGLGAAASSATSQPTIEQLVSEPKMQKAMEFLSGAPLPPVKTAFITDDALKTAYTALTKGESETIDPDIFQRVSEKSVHDALLNAEEQALTISDVFDEPLKMIGKLKSEIGKLAGAADTTPAVRHASATLSAAAMRFQAAREAREAQANQVTAYLYEIQVHRAAIQSERHRIRSRYFFFGMLGVQAAVTIATIAIAAREKNALWSLSAGIGAMAVTYAGYVYLFT